MDVVLGLLHRGLDGGVECEEVRLSCDFTDGGDDVLDGVGARDELLRDTRDLGHGVADGIILLDAANLSQSEILSPARYKKQMDYAVMYELAEKNRDFSQFLTTITEYDHKNPHRYLSEFDEVLDDDAMTKYLVTKGILSDGKDGTI